jgi:hypothetical protein
MTVLLVMLGYGVAFVLGMVFGWWLRGQPEEESE